MRETHPPKETFHQDTHTGMAYLFYYMEKKQFGKISMKTMTAVRSAGAVEKSVCCFVYNVKVTDDL